MLEVEQDSQNANISDHLIGCENNIQSGNEFPTVANYGVFPTDKNEGLIEMIDAKSIQNILSTDKIKNNIKDLKNYCKSLGKLIKIFHNNLHI